VLTAPTRRQAETLLAYLASAVVTGFAVFRCLSVMPFVPLAVTVTLVLGLRVRLLRL
jgi:hypothetical protein